MLWQQTLEKMREMKLRGMLKGAEEQESSTGYKKMSFEDRLGHLVDHEHLERENRRLSARLRQAKFRQQATMEDVDFKYRRNLVRSQFMEFGKCRWIKEHKNIILTGPSGVGKSYLACAIGNKACLEGYKVQYIRVPRFLTELMIGKGDGSYLKMMKALSRVDVLILDDWGIAKLTDEQRKEFLEVMEDRYELKSTIITSQIPVKNWHDVIGDSTIADAILDRIVHNAYRIELNGESMRKKDTKEDERKDRVKR